MQMVLVSAFYIFDHQLGKRIVPVRIFFDGIANINGLLVFKTIEITLLSERNSLYGLTHAPIHHIHLYMMKFAANQLTAACVGHTSR